VITFFQAILMGLVQGASELFPISSLGHSVLIAYLFNWNNILASQSRSESFFLSFLVILHVATALALFIFYFKIWKKIIIGFFKSVADREIKTSEAKLAWLLLIGTVPAGITGLLLEHILRVQFAKPLSAIVFLFINGLILLAGDYYQKNHPKAKITKTDLSASSKNIAGKLTLGRACLIGVAQTGALLAGISRSGITIVSGLFSGLDYEDAARFSFLLATPIIFGAGIIKIPDFFSSLDNGVRGQILAGGVAAFIAAYITVRYLDKYFKEKTLRPFAYYCMSVSIIFVIIGVIRGHF